MLELIIMLSIGIGIVVFALVTPYVWLKYRNAREWGNVWSKAFWAGVANFEALNDAAVAESQRINEELRNVCQQRAELVMERDQALEGNKALAGRLSRVAGFIQQAGLVIAGIKEPPTHEGT